MDTQHQDDASSRKVGDVPDPRGGSLPPIEFRSSSVLHDLRNVLMIVYAQSAEFMAQVVSSQHTRQMARDLHAAIESAVGVALAEPSREVEPERTCVTRLLSQLTPFLRHAAGSEVSVRVFEGTEDRWARAGDVAVTRLLLNICSNAGAAMAGGGYLSIWLDGTVLQETRALRPGEVSAGRYVRITVEDTGAGMTPAALERAFRVEPLTDDATEGGLGLSIATDILRRIGGGLTVTSSPSRGTRFELLFPEADAPASD